MRSMKLLAKKALLFALKLLIVALPVVAGSYYSYRAGLRDSLKYYHELADIADNTATLLDRQALLLEHMRGEISVLRMLAVARTGSGLPGLPSPEYLRQEDCCPETPESPWQMAASGKTVLCSKHLTTRK